MISCLIGGGGGGGSGSGLQVTPFYYKLTATDITNKNFTLPVVPSNAANVVLDIPSGAPQIYSAAMPSLGFDISGDFTITGQTIDWDGRGLDGNIYANNWVRVLIFS